MELLVLVNQPPKWTLSGVINIGVFATLNGVTPIHFKPYKPKCYTKLTCSYRNGTGVPFMSKIDPKNVVDAQCLKSYPFSMFLLMRSSVIFEWSPGGGDSSSKQAAKNSTTILKPLHVQFSMICLKSTRMTTPSCLKSHITQDNVVYC